MSPSYLSFVPFSCCDLNCHSTWKINGLYTTLIGNNCIHHGLLTLIVSVDNPMLCFVRITDRQIRLSFPFEMCQCRNSPCGKGFRN